MNSMHGISKESGGFTMIEVLLAMIIIAVSAVAVLMWQKTSWSQTSATNRLIVAGHVITKQIEKQRLQIAESPVNNFAAFIQNSSMVIVDSSITPYLQVQWTIYSVDSLKDPNNIDIANARKVKISVGYGTRPTDTLTVITAISRNF
jgi:prepilin-type N-terminal cleavage/methylation domain-containing protein